MKHARPDYEHIQDSLGLIPEDEPVFLLRAQDIFAPSLVRKWGKLMILIGREREGRMAIAQAQAMIEWQDGKGKKIPDVPDSSIRDRGSKKPCRNCNEFLEECACLRNKCKKCGEPVGNINYSVCQTCRDKY